MSSTEFEARGSHCASLEEELEDIEQKQSEVVDLEEKERQLDELRRRVRELANEVQTARADHRRRCAEAALPVIQPREPCTAPWDQMKGNDHVRTCGRCKQRVYDLSSLTPDEARRLVLEREGKVPAHFVGRVDGTVTVGSCAQPQKKWPPRLVGIAAAAAVAVLGTGVAIGYLGAKEQAPPVIRVSLSEQLVDRASTAAHPPGQAMMGADEEECDDDAYGQWCGGWIPTWLGGSAGFFLYYSDDWPHEHCRERRRHHRSHR